MQYDIKLVKSILLAIENFDAGSMPAMPIIDSYSKPQIAYHIHIMQQDGLVEALPLTSQASTIPHGFSEVQLTAKGHTFLSNARNDTVWKKVIAEAEAKGSSTSFVVINALLSKAAQKYAGLD